MTDRPESAHFTRGRDLTLLQRGDLRYVLLDQLKASPFRAHAVCDLCESLESRGFAVAGRPSKTVSDALRAAVRRGHVIRLRRGQYQYVDLPKTTAWRVEKRVTELRQLSHVVEPVR